MPVDASLAFLRRAALLGAAVLTVALAGPVRAEAPAAAADPNAPKATGFTLNINVGDGKTVSMPGQRVQGFA